MPIENDGFTPVFVHQGALITWKRFRKYSRLILSGLADENHDRDFHHFVFFSVRQLIGFQKVRRHFLIGCDSQKKKSPKITVFCF